MFALRLLHGLYCKVLYKTGKVLTQRGMEKNAENCELIRTEVEAFKTFVPLVQVSGGCTMKSTSLLPAMVPV
jgi:hypothetical protein